MLIKNNLREIRKSRGYSLEKLSELADVEYAIIRDFEDVTAGDNHTHLYGMGSAVEIILQLCRALDITPNDLLWNGIHDNEPENKTYVKNVSLIKRVLLALCGILKVDPKDIR